MLGVTEQPGASHANDAVGEVCNMVAGCFKAKIDGLEDKCMLSVPTVISGGNFELHSLEVGDRIDLTRLFQDEAISFSLQIRF